MIAHLANASWPPLIAKSGYCVGFLAVILGRHCIPTLLGHVVGGVSLVAGLGMHKGLEGRNDADRGYVNLV